MPLNTIQLATYLSPELAEKTRKEAEKEGRTISNFLAYLVTKYLADNAE